jgi:hypothetical protein
MLADENFKLATLAERGLIWTICVQCWVSDSAPADHGELAQVLGLGRPDLEAAFTARVLGFFVELNGRLFREELREQKAQMMARREEQARGGRRGAKAKWGKAKRQMTSPLANPSATPMAPEKNRADMNCVDLKRGEKRASSPNGLLAPRKSDEEEILEYRRAFGEI